MQDNPPDNPYDEFLMQLARIVEDILKNLPEKENCQFIGCTIISGNVTGALPADTLPGMPPGTHHLLGHDCIPYEMIDGGDRVFITVPVPAGVNPPPYAEIQPDSILIHAGGREIHIKLPSPADVSRSYFRVSHRVMDIVVSKRQVPLPDMNEDATGNQ